MPNLDSQTVDTLVGVGFVFLLLSTVASGITETVSWFLQQRAASLEKGLRRWLADDETLDELLEHPLIKNLSASQRKLLGERRTGSYVSARDFGLAFLDTLAPPQPGTAGSRDILAQVRAKVNGAGGSLPDGLNRQLEALLDEAGNDVGRFRQSIERWFDDAMERISGSYKRWSQLAICVVAAVLTIGLNVNTVRIADRLWTDDAVRTSVADAASRTVEQASGTPVTPDQAAANAEESGQAAQEAASQLDSLQLPIGWTAANDDMSWSVAAGWFITFIAVSAGAPFWFDALGRLARLRTTGGKPAGSSAS